MGVSVDPNTTTVITSFIIYGALGVIFLNLFEICRQKNKIVYEPRKLSNKLKSPSTELVGCNKWISAVLAVEDEETLQIVGFDAFVLLKFMRLLVNISGFAALAAFIFLLPVYGTADADSSVQGINLMSMASLQEKDYRLWAPFFFAWIFTLYLLYLLYNEYKQFSELRQKFFINPGDDFPIQAAHSCLVENIPSNEIKSGNELKAFFEEIFPGEVHSAFVTSELKELEKLFAEREGLIVKYENAVAADEATKHDPKKTPMVKLNNKSKPAMLFGQKTPAIDYYRSEIVRLNEEIESKQTLLKDAAHSATPDSGKLGKISSTGFVTFSSMKTLLAAQQKKVVSDVYPKIRLFPASAPKDVIWSNIAIPKSSSDIMKVLVFIILTLGILFWAVIIAFIGAVSQLTYLSPYLPFINDLDPVSYSIIAGLLPVIVLSVFLSLVPVIIAAFATNVEGRKSESDVDEFVCGWYFIYSLANVYLVLLSGSVINSLSDIISNPASIASLLGKAIPSMQNFFINVLLSKWLLGVPLMLVRIAPLVLGFIFAKISKPESTTIRGFFSGAMAPVYFGYATDIPAILYTVLVVLLYWVIAPVVTAVAFFLFGAQYVALKYQFLYVNQSRYQTGGRFFYQLYQYTMVALVMSILAIIGLMGLKVATAQAVLLVPLLVIAIAVWFYTVRKFKPLTVKIAESSIKDIDSSPVGEATTTQFDTQFYEQPALQEESLKARVFPYRFGGVPILNEQKQLDPSYFDAMDLKATDLEKYRPLGALSIGDIPVSPTSKEFAAANENEIF